MTLLKRPKKSTQPKPASPTYLPGTKITQAEADIFRIGGPLVKLAEANAGGRSSPAVLAKRERDIGGWLRYYFPDSFTRPFTRSQRQFLDFVVEIEAGKYFRPIVLCDPRGVGKSTLGEGVLCWLLATKRRSYAVLVSSTDDQAVKHLRSVRQSLESPLLKRDYPHLIPQLQSHKGGADNWSSERLLCASGQVVEVASILGKIRGFKNEVNVRPDILLPDDIDKLRESVEVTNGKREVLRNDFLFALARHGSTLFLQNLIHRNSVCKSIMDGTGDLLNDRRFIGPNPLMKWYEAHREQLADGGWVWKIDAGEPFDPSTTVEFCEQELTKSGRSGFNRECQQLVEVVDEENDFREYDEIYHVCTVDEIIAGFRRQGAELPSSPIGRVLRIPDRWQCADGLDAGHTIGHPGVYGLFTRPDKRFPFDDVILSLLEHCAPMYPLPVGETPEVVSPGRMRHAIVRRRGELGVQDAQIVLSLMSHEASAWLNAFIQDCEADDPDKLFFSKWRARKGSGVPQMQGLMEIDRSRPHPFRVYPARHPNAGERVMGYTRFILVVARGQGELYMDEAGVLRVKGALDALGHARARFEIPLYNHRNQGDHKKNDDWVDCARGLLGDWVLQPGSYTPTERRDKQLPDNLQYANFMPALKQVPAHEQWALIGAREFELAQLAEREQEAARKADMTSVFEQPFNW